MNYFSDLITRYPALSICQSDIEQAHQIMVDSFTNNGKLLLCGNGGSAADCEHISGELLKGFIDKRPFPKGKRRYSDEVTDEFYNNLQLGLPAISLTSNGALISAWNNDCDPDYVYAQQLHAYANYDRDVLFAISTSGNSKNVVKAVQLAKANGMKVISLTGQSGGKLNEISDICIKVPSTITAFIQEYHLPVYHAMCAQLEHHFFIDNKEV